MRKQAVLAILAGAVSLSAFAHEFWIDAAPFDPRLQARSVVTLNVGEFFRGERVGVTGAHAASVRLLSANDDRDLGRLIPEAGMLPSLTLSFAQPGTHVIAYESQPSRIELSADKFHAYLHDEGLDAVIRHREAAGTAQMPGRERYRRSAKALLRVGARADLAFARSTAQRLEILPLDDPLSAAAGARLRFTLRFEGQPRPGVLVKAWHRLGAQTTVIRATTDAQGDFSLVLPFDGMWMLNAVHMRAAADSPDVDWDSFWGSLTFKLGLKEEGSGR